MKSQAKLIDWLLAGDVAIKYQSRRDLLGQEDPSLQARISGEGWGARFLAQRQANLHWGRGFYQPKWTSSHYTLLDLKYLQIARDHPAIRETLDLIARSNKADDGGIHPIGTVRQSDA